MARRRVGNILRKEWRVLASDATFFLMIGFMPFAILGEALFIIFVVASVGGKAMAANPFFQGAINNMLTGNPAAAALPDIDQVKLLLLTQFNFFILLIPTMIAIYSAAYSIVEEKLSRSIEPLLATPVRTWELMLGKALAGAIPALLVTWLCAVLALGVLALLGWGRLLPYLISTGWVINVFLLTPVIAVLSFLLGVIGSSRAKDFRNAQNLVFLIIFPVFGIIALQVTGLVWFTPLVSILLAVGLILVDILVLRIAVGLFQREVIVIKWR